MSDLDLKDTVAQTQEATPQNLVVDKKPDIEIKIEETTQDRNWRQFREAREQDRKRNDASEKLAREKAAEAEALKAAMEAILNKQQPQPQQYQDTSSEYEDDDTKIQKKIDEALAKRERQYEQERMARDKQDMPTKLKTAYQDFNSVCSADNLDYMEFHYPEIAKAFVSMPESFDKWSSIYHACKKLIPNSASSKQEQARAEKNMSKPQSMSAAGATATGDHSPYMLNEKKKADNWLRMQKVRKGIA